MCTARRIDHILSPPLVLGNAWGFSFVPRWMSAQLPSY